MYPRSSRPCSALEAAIRKHSAGSSSTPAAFAGKGHTLGGGPAPTDNLAGNAKRAVGDATAGASAAFDGLNPQVKVLVGLTGLYALFWFLG